MAGTVGGGGADDDMIEEFDFQKLAGADEVASHFDVCLAGGCVTGWVIVHGDDGGGVGNNGGAEHFGAATASAITAHTAP